VRRTILTLVLATVAVLLPAQGASAGGNWLGFREAPRAGSPAGDGSGGGGNLGTWAVLHVGQEVVAHTGVYATNLHLLDRLESEGPFYAWLSTGDAYLDDTNLPADAIRLAPFTIGFDGSNGVPVRARFTVPDVPSGEYEVVVCNDPCTLSGFGEYIQGWITIMQTPVEARLFESNRDRKWEARELSKKIGRLEGDVDSLVGELAAAQGETRAAALDLRSTDRTIELLKSENEALLARLAAAERGVQMPLWALLAFAIAIVAGAFLLRRRRVLAFEIPDTVPDDLVERDRAGI
jgi:hypothetical protein